MIMHLKIITIKIVFPVRHRTKDHQVVSGSTSSRKEDMKHRLPQVNGTKTIPKVADVSVATSSAICVKTAQLPIPAATLPNQAKTTTRF